MSPRQRLRYSRQQQQMPANQFKSRLAFHTEVNKALGIQEGYLKSTVYTVSQKWKQDWYLIRIQMSILTMSSVHKMQYNPDSYTTGREY